MLKALAQQLRKKMSQLNDKSMGSATQTDKELVNVKSSGTTTQKDKEIGDVDFAS